MGQLFFKVSSCVCTDGIDIAKKAMFAFVLAIEYMKNQVFFEK